jgi:hypothetical protein
MRPFDTPVADVADVASPQTITPTRPRYLKTIAEYAVDYGRSPRQVKRWLKRDSDFSDFPPLDSPSLMAGWWARNFKIRVPGKILSYATGPGPDDRKSAPAVKLADAPQSPEARLNWLRRMAPALQQQMADALFGGQHFAAESIRRMLSPIHKELLELESQLSSVRQGEEPLSSAQIRALELQQSIISDNLRTCRDTAAKNIARRAAREIGVGLIPLYRAIDALPAEEAEKIKAIASALESDLARRSSEVFERWLEEQARLFSKYMELVAAINPDESARVAEILGKLPPDRVEDLLRNGP